MIRSPTPLLNTKLKELPKNTTKRDLTYTQRAHILERRERGESLRVIAKELCISTGTVANLGVS